MFGDGHVEKVENQHCIPNITEKDNDNQFLLEKLPGPDGKDIRQVDSEEGRNMDAETDNINTMLNPISNHKEGTKLFNADLDQINIKSDDMEILIECPHEAELGNDESPIIDTGNIDYAETGDMEWNVYQSCYFMSISEQKDCVKIYDSVLECDGQQKTQSKKKGNSMGVEV